MEEKTLKKKRIIIICCAMILTIAVIGIIYYMNAPILEMNRTVSNGGQVANGCGITIDSGKEVLVKYDSTVKDGDITIRLTDENWNTIKEFQADVYGEEKIYLESGKYNFRVESEYFKGTYHVKVYD